MTKASKQGSKQSANVELTGDAARYAGASTVPSDQKENYINVKEAAALLRLSEISIRRMLWKRKLKRYKCGGRTLLRESQVLSLIHEA